MDRGHPHELQHAAEFGRSPGNGTTPMAMSRDPLATEGEATPGPDDVNPYDEAEDRLVADAQNRARELAARRREDAPGALAARDDVLPLPALESDGFGVALDVEGVSVDAPTVDAPSPSVDLGGW